MDTESRAMRRKPGANRGEARAKWRREVRARLTRA